MLEKNICSVIVKCVHSSHINNTTVEFIQSIKLSYHDMFIDYKVTLKKHEIMSIFEKTRNVKRIQLRFSTYF